MAQARAGSARADGQRVERAQGKGLAPGELVGRELQPGKTAEQPADGDRALQARQRRTGAEMNAMAEGEVAVVGPSDVEAVWVRKACRIAVRGAHQDQDPLPLRDPSAPDLDGLPRDPHALLHRA